MLLAQLIIYNCSRIILTSSVSFSTYHDRISIDNTRLSSRSSSLLTRKQTMEGSLRCLPAPVSQLTSDKVGARDNVIHWYDAEGRAWNHVMCNIRVSEYVCNVQSFYNLRLKKFEWEDCLCCCIIFQNMIVMSCKRNIKRDYSLLSNRRLSAVRITYI